MVIYSPIYVFDHYLRNGNEPLIIVFGVLNAKYTFIVTHEKRNFNENQIYGNGCN